jgi:hypothetical protein
MLYVLLAASALAGDYRIAHTDAVGTGIADVVTDPSGRYVAMLEESTGQVRILDTYGWDVDAVDVCTGTGTSLATGSEPGGAVGTRLYVGCTAGQVGWVTLDGSIWSAETTMVDVGSGDVLALVVVQENVWVIAEQADGEGNPQLFGFPETTTPESAEVTEYGILGSAGIEDFAPATAVGIVSHANDRLSRIDGNTGGITTPTTTIGIANTLDVLITDGNAVLAAAGDGGVVTYSTGGAEMGLALDDSDGLENVTAITWMDDWLWVADAGRAELLAYVMASTSTTPGDDVQATVSWPEEAAASGEAVVEFAVLDGYAVGGTDLGSLWVLTDRPWVESYGVSPAAAVSGDEVVVQFSSDTAGDWSVLLDATSDSDGTVLATGTTSGTDEISSASLTIGSAYAEGDNDLRIVVEDEQGLTGHDVATVNVDNPPGQVSFPVSAVSFGDQQVLVSFDALDDADVTEYAIFVTTEPFSRSDWASCDEDVDPCGPAYEGPDSLNGPKTVEGTPGGSVSHTLSPLTNGVTYYIAVRATDASDQEGPMSKVRSVTPRATFSAAQLAGDDGGFCGTALPATGFLAGLGLLVAVGRRRRSVLATPIVGLGLLLGFGAGLSPVAHAEPGTFEEPGLKDRSAQTGTVAVRYGPLTLVDDNITDTLGEDGNQVLWVEMGPRIVRQVEATVGFGWFQELGNKVTASGASSGETNMLTILPLSLNATLRGEFVDDQVFVPHGSVGVDYWLWKENWQVNEDVGGDSQVSGGKPGWHWALGGNLLLDKFDPARASWLQARSGVDATWFTAEYRYQNVGDVDDGLHFEGATVGLGLKVDY